MDTNNTSLQDLIFSDYQTMSLSGLKSTWLRVIILWLSRLAFRVVINYRLGHCFRTKNIRLLGWWFDRKNWKLGVDICSAAQIGPGLRLAHPHGIVISGKAVIGHNAYIQQSVTIGGTTNKKRERDGKIQEVAYIGNNVQIGAGAKIIGPVTIGDHSIIGANAVVVNDVGNNILAVGIPAKNKKMVSNDSSRI